MARQSKLLALTGSGVLVYKQGMTDLRISRITRRALVLAGATALLAGAISRPGHALADPITPDDPRTIVNAIYTRVAKGKGDGGGGFVTASKADRTRNLSRSLVALWLKADAHTPKGDVGPVDFDPVTNSQEPDVKSFEIKTESFDSQHATIAVTIIGRNAARKNPADAVIRYNFVRDPAQWKIDDIRGADDGKPWSLRGMLSDSLKN
jgi:hypothetical protein